MTELTDKKIAPNVGLILTCAVLVLLLAMGVRATFGLFMQPMGLAHGWDRETFSLAFAIQNLVWGVGSVLFGALADKQGSGRTIAMAACFYAAGLIGLHFADTPLTLYLTAGLLVGLGQSGTTFGVVLGVVGRAVSPAHRSVALGIASAGGSLGQFVMVPVGQYFIGSFGWAQALLSLSMCIALVLPLTLCLTGKPDDSATQAKQTLGQAVTTAVRQPSFHFLFWSFFVCGFHTAFITLHLPAYVIDQGFRPEQGAFALALIGLFNVLGSYGAGWLGGRYSKKKLLTWVYGLRAVAILFLLFAPKTVFTLYVFAASMGLLWLGTVPLTNGLVGQIFGVRYVSTLYGVIFFGHQIGSFIGVWLGGKVYVATHSYDLVWWIAIALALAAAVTCWPIDERSVNTVNDGLRKAEQPNSI